MAFLKRLSRSASSRLLLEASLLPGDRRVPGSFALCRGDGGHGAAASTTDRTTFDAGSPPTSNNLGASEPRTPGVPTFWTVAWHTVRRLIKGPLAAPPPNAARDSLLLDASVAIRSGRADDAWELLAPQRPTLANDPGYLNLLGAVCELRRQWRRARRFYGVAISIAPRFAPAQQNMRRLYELYTFGRSQVPLSLGDAELRRGRTIPESTVGTGSWRPRDGR